MYGKTDLPPKPKYVGPCTECGSTIYSDKMHVKVKTKRKTTNLYCEKCYKKICKGS